MNADLAYRACATDQSNRPRMVVLLYEQLIKDLRQALAAIERKDIEARTFEISHALIVVGQLQACLDMDRGAEVARNLDHFYALIRKALLEAQTRASDGLLRAQIANLLTLRDAWAEVEKAEIAVPSPPAPTPSEAEGSPSAEWHA